MAQNSIDPSEKIKGVEFQKLDSEGSSIQNNPTSAGQIWNRILHLGLGETALRIGTVIATITLVVLVVWVMSKFFLKSQINTPTETISPEQAATTLLLPISEEFNPLLSSNFGINRLVQLHTNLPAKPRTDIIEYEIVKGDTLFGIAEKFGVKPETLLWSNRHILGDDPHNIFPGVKILVPPFDGAIHQWFTGDGLNGVAKFFHVSTDAILDWPGNHLDRNTIGDFALPNIAKGNLIFIPYGYGEFTDWLPVFTRNNPAVASSLGPGFCGSVMDGPIGNGTFVWPTTETWISGFNYSPATNHRGIDISGKIGNAIYAVDDGVVVYSGWNNNGYGNLIIVDHGNGWQSVYAHLDTMAKGCGDYVFQGDVIAGLGTTGNSSGPHLHFELRNGTSGTVNPFDFLQ
ncbi:MAG: M23 family metallopeptidase [Chloroflexi bacterium]|nr:M23 family metallopeptidase [Chloroflexota bacterium]